MFADTESGARSAPGKAARIVHVVLGLDVGGLERVVLRLLANTDRSRWDPCVIALDHEGALAPQLAEMDVPITVVKRREGIDTELPFTLSRTFRRDDVAIVHTHNASPHLYGAVAANIARASGAKTRVIHTKHGRNAPEAPRKVLVNRVASALSDRVVAVSDDARSVAIDIEHVAPKKVVTILNGVDTREYAPGGDVAKARAELGAPREGFHVGCVARLAEVKDHPTLLAAFAELKRRRGDAHLTFVGDGEERAKLEALAKSLGLGSAVTFAGNRSDIAGALPAFDVFALASTSEGISLTLLEAAAAGLPIVATDVGGNGEVVVDGVTGKLVPAKDAEALANALASMEDPGLRRRMGLAGRERVQARFSVEGMARAYHQLYEEVLA